MYVLFCSVLFCLTFIFCSHYYCFLNDTKSHYSSDADRLCNDIKQEILENLDGESFQLTYERSTECEIPESWLKAEIPDSSWLMVRFN